MNNSGTTNNVELDQFGKKLFGKKYIGTYPANTFVEEVFPSMKNDEACIVNTQNHGENGEHWLALIRHNDKLYAYDSYGQPIQTYNPIFKKLGKIMQDTKDSEQKYIPLETNCGQRSLWQIEMFKRHGPEAFLLV